MVLSSQIGRPGSSRRSNNYRRSRRAWRRPIIAGMALIAAFAVWHFWPTGGANVVTPVNANANAAGSGQGDSSATPVVPVQQAGLIPSSVTAPTTGQQPAPRTGGSTNTTAPAPGNLQDNLRRANEELHGSAGRSSAPVVGPTVPDRHDPAASSAKTGTAAIADAVKAEIEAAKSATGPSHSIAGQKGGDKAGHADVKKGNDSSTLAQAGIATAPNPVLTQSLSVAVQAARVTLTTPGITGANLRDGMNLIADGKLVQGRKMLSKVLISPDANITAKDAQTIRDTLISVNKSLIFSDRILEGDTLVEQYTIQSGDLLSIVARKFTVTYQLLEQINNIDSRRIRVGQRIKVLKGPFHVVVSKSNFRMDLFLKDADSSWVYATSFPVGVGKDDSTPNGSWICRDNGKLSNPGWTSPRTSEYFAPDDPKNPIGEYWIALDGTDESTKGLRGYGIHGTIDRDSIGKQMSLGCVRLLPEHIEQVYKLLVDGKSTVTIQP
ncbi:MAG: L,D-transpeptidase family protein [Phycisphaeraceae bacterium]